MEKVGSSLLLDRGRDANGNVILTNEGNFNAYEYYMHAPLLGYRLGWIPVYGQKEPKFKEKVVIYPNDEYFSKNKLDLGNIINDESRNAIVVDHFYANDGTTYLPIFVGGHSGVETNSGNGYGVLSIYTPQVVKQKPRSTMVRSIRHKLV